MKKRNLFLSIFLLVLFALPVYAAQSLESVRVIKFWTDTNDMVVQRETGERLLLQHNRLCSSMSTEFPIQLLWLDKKVTQVKIASNEICKVYGFGPYSSDVKISKRVPSPNLLTPEHLAEIEWQGSRYQIDYGKECKGIKDYVGHVAYVYTPKSDLNGATLYLPGARGQCAINSATFLEALPAPVVLQSPIKNLKNEAQNNQVLFSWDALPENEIWSVLVAYSKFQLNPKELNLDQMPNLKRSKTNSIQISQLVNDQAYYFYVTAQNGAGDLASWTELKIAPTNTTHILVNNPDPEKFDLTMTETDTAYHLTWPDKKEKTKKYLITIFVDGKQKMFKYIPASQNVFDLLKKPEWSKSKFRVTLRSIPIKSTMAPYSDGLFWEKK